MNRTTAGQGGRGRVIGPVGSRYDQAAQRSAATVIGEYSTSFGWASRLLQEPVRAHVRSIYALVRVADEIVDDADLDLDAGMRRELLDDLEKETLKAVDRGHSTNLVVHAFALAARGHGIDSELIAPFFASMRADLDVSVHDPASLEQYVYGSAEVVGLMCLHVFVGGDPAAYARLRDPARSLGSAFQKVNFLRDLAEDHDQLGRSYFPGLDPTNFGDRERDQLLDEIDAELAVAAAAIDELPHSSRRAVAAAHAFYRALSERLRATPAAQIRRARVRVPDHHKARILARVIVGGRA